MLSVCIPNSNVLLKKKSLKGAQLKVTDNETRLVLFPKCTCIMGMLEFSGGGVL